MFNPQTYQIEEEIGDYEIVHQPDKDGCYGYWFLRNWKTGMDTGVFYMTREAATIAAAELHEIDLRKVDKEKARREKRNAAARKRRAVLDDVYDSVGMKRVRGARGGIYYE